jgi:hypothetical protein
VKAELPIERRLKDVSEANTSGSCPLKAVSKEISCCNLTRPPNSLGSVPVSKVPKSHTISVVKQDRVEREIIRLAIPVRSTNILYASPAW